MSFNSEDGGNASTLVTLLMGMGIYFFFFSPAAHNAFVLVHYVSVFTPVISKQLRYVSELSESRRDNLLVTALHNLYFQ